MPKRMVNGLKVATGNFKGGPNWGLGSSFLILNKSSMPNRMVMSKSDSEVGGCVRGGEANLRLGLGPPFSIFLRSRYG